MAIFRVSLLSIRIYIPIWWDLKLFCLLKKVSSFHLHSNMVRFKVTATSTHKITIADLHSNMVRFKGFTWWDYCCISSIYIPIWWDLKKLSVLARQRKSHLHSNMVRFKVTATISSMPALKFTFQYGEI